MSNFFLKDVLAKPVIVLAIAICSISLLTGCATIGHDFAASEVKNIQIGKTTQDEIKAMFGTPWRTGVDDGRKTWTYGIYHYSLFNDARTQDLVIRFNDKDIVASFTYNTTEHQE
jgi:outer membrane protein assembly factor BamE (lipoprotein component of BamABCDE complex)